MRLMNNDTEIIAYGLLTLSLLCVISTTLKLTCISHQGVRTHDTSSAEKLANKKPPSVSMK